MLFRSGETTKIKKGVVKNNGTRVSHRTGTLNGFGRGSRANSVDLAGKKTKQICGILDTFKDNLAIIRKNYAEDEDDTFIPINVVRKYKLQPGDVICGEAREPKENDRYWGLLSITSVNDVPLEEYLKQTRVKSHLWDFLETQKGLDTLIAEKVGNLSGGQRQCLALARALLHDAPVYIFDEATSNIDAESEEMIMDVIHELTKEKTVLLISHRLSNVTCRSRSEERRVGKECRSRWSPYH